MTHEEKVLKYLEQNGSITSLEMFDNFYICCPTSTIRNLRKKLGNDAITDIWQEKKRKEHKENGQEKQVTIRYKRYFLNILGANIA